jgi:hypothetical protein
MDNMDAIEADRRAKERENRGFKWSWRTVKEQMGDYRRKVERARKPSTWQSMYPTIQEIEARAKR